MTDRRELIADAAIAVIARSGLRALTHRAVDSELDLPGGSTSYYFRTKRALLEAAVRHLTERSRQHFESATAASEVAPTTDDMARFGAEILDRLLDERLDDVRARYALTVELADDPELHRLLAGSLFSRPRAVELLQALGATDPDTAGADFVSVVEGVVFDRFAGARSFDGLTPGTRASIDQLAGALGAYLRGAVSAG
ncbi:TetR/AcrR family transcriptional regulator [Rhodococcus sp. NPDC058521]|uniref:TetR/AcrR family transcriptional regulator n=1 Tax=Rhodococcus sp. NPDC058521 TaxID=3346536 RepID=UPI00365689D0